MFVHTNKDSRLITDVLTDVFETSAMVMMKQVRDVIVHSPG